MICNWCGNEDAASGQRCLECGLVADGPVLENIQQIRLYAVGQGYRRPSYDKIKKAINEHALVPRKGGGWTKGTVDSWLISTCPRATVVDPDADKPAIRPEEGTGAAAEKASADAELKRLQAARERIRLARDRKQIIPRELYEKDLAARMAFFSNQLDVFTVPLAKLVVDLICGDSRKARRIISLVSGSEEKDMVLIGYVQQLVPEIADILLREKQRWLSAFASDRIQVVEIEEFLEADDNLELEDDATSI